jgi:O-antigen ligase
VAAAALIVCAVVAVDPGGLAPFGPIKWLLVPALVLAAFATAPTISAERRTTVAWSVFLAVAAVSAVAGLDPLYAWIGTPERRFGALTWLLCAIAFVAGRRDRRLTAAAATACAVAGVWALVETVGWEPIELVGAGDRAVGPLGSSAYLGAARALLVPVAIAHRTRLAYAGAALGGFALVASGARAAWVGALVAAALVVVARRVDGRVVAGVVIGVVAVGALTGVLGRVPDLVTDDDGGIAGRVDEWRIAANVIADHPVTGAGPEGYRIAFGRAVDDAYEIEHGRDQLPDRAHSAPLDVAATLGLPGLLAYLALLAVTAPFVWRALRDGDLVAAGVVAYLVQSLFLFPIAELEPVAWLLAGTLVAGRRVAPPSGVRVVAAGLAIAVAFAGVLDVVADRRAKGIIDGDDIAADAAATLRPDAIRYRLAAARVLPPDDAIEQLDRAIDVSPLDPVVRSERADLLLEIDVEAALVALEALAEDDPRNAEVLLRLGVARARTGDLDGAEQAWTDAARLAPDSDAARINLERLHEQREESGT